MIKTNRRKTILKRTATALLCVVTLVAVLVIFALEDAYDYDPVSTEQLSHAELADVKKLMIVAHPDDESLWGGGHLLEGGYFVVCLTGLENKTRSKEFAAAMEATGNKYIMLDYPDKTLFRRNDWSRCRDDIITDLKTIIAYSGWELVVTHNPDGEYGHSHHVMTSEMVTGARNETASSAKLYYFGRYFTKAALDASENKPPELDKDILKAKLEKLLPVYKSQDDVVESLYHMMPYEDWTLYDDAP